MNELQKAAEILVEWGYAEANAENGIILVKHSELHIHPESVDPFYSGDNTHRECLSRRQSDAIEDWLYKNRYKIWSNSMADEDFDSPTQHQWRLDRIKWCLQELCGEN